VFRITLAVLFWGSLFGACYAAYRYLGSDIPWGEVAAVVTEQRKDADDGLLRDKSRTEFPPIAPETVSADTSFSYAPQNRKLTPVKLAWGAQNKNGISVLVLPDGAPASDLSSLSGSVTGSRVRLRAEPSTRSRILGALERGEGVGIMRRFSSGKEEFSWYNVRTEKGSGWIYGEFVRVIEDE
jgi:hypothetical protein